MEKTRASRLMLQCRLCGILGHHSIAIFEENVGSDSALCERIYRCVEVRVERSDESTNICGKCFCKIYDFVRFRELCAATHEKMQKSKGQHSVSLGDVMGELSPTRESNLETENSSDRIICQNRGLPSDPPVECISLLDDETDSEIVEGNEEPNGAKKHLSFSDGRAAATQRGRSDEAEREMQGRKKHCKGTVTNWGCESSPAGSTTSLRAGAAGQMTNLDTQNSIVSMENEAAEQDSNTEQEPTESPNEIDYRNGSPVAVALLTEVVAAPDSDRNDDCVQNDVVRKADVTAKPKNWPTNKSVQDASMSSIACRSAGLCKESFESWDAMMFHVATYHAKGKKRTFCCHLCKKTSGTKQALQRHMNGVHNREIRFMCPIRSCAKIFTQKCDLKRHTNGIHTKAVAFKCTKCSMKFYQKVHLTRHLANKHGKGIIFSCYLCKKQLSSKHSLEGHMNAHHTGQGSFICPIRLCAKIFAHKWNLNHHTNAVHTKAVAFKCQKCSMKFYQKVHLTRHLANKHGKGIIFRCYLCKKQLSAKQKLQMHMNVLHTGQARLKCQFPNCSKSFTQKSDLNRHTNAIHT